MSIETTPLPDDERKLFDALPSDGTTVSNAVMQRRLEWDSDFYFRTRDALVDRGLVQRGRGRGGVVRRGIPADKAEEHTVSVVVEVGADPAATIEAVIKSELALYEPMSRVIRTDWAKDRRREPLAVEITALQGRRATGGLWSRPDIVSIEVRTFPYVPGKYLEISSFEVKASNAINVQAVYEALAHRRAATHSYVLLHVPTDRAAPREEEVAAVAEVARSHGIGVIVAADPGDYQTWDEREEAARVEPDPERLNTFVAQQLSEQTRDLVSRRLR